jgi:AbrB family looped-hinge helix DNA binding protein
MKVKVTRNYQITIPSTIRTKLKVELGDILDIMYDEKRGEIIIRKVEGKRKTLKSGRKLTPEEIESLIELGLKRSL